jgi:hypothetical protein
MSFMFLLSKIDFPRIGHRLIIKNLWLLHAKATLGRR